MKHAYGDPSLAAHRGGGGGAPENTLGAISRTLDQGIAGWIEIDIHRSRDGHLIVCHDNDVGRTTDASVKNLPSTAIADLDLKDLRKLNAGSWFGEIYAGERLPLFEEVVKTIGDRCGLMVEIKSPDDYPGIADDIVRVLRDTSPVHPSSISFWSSHLSLLQELDEKAPEFAKGWFVRRVASDFVAPNTKILSSIGVWPQITRRDVIRAQRLGLSTVAATMNSLNRFRAAKAVGADIILTDFPEIAANNAENKPMVQFDPVRSPKIYWYRGKVLTEITLRVQESARAADVAASGALPWTLRRVGGTVLHPLDLHVEESTLVVTLEAPIPRPGKGPAALALYSAEGVPIDSVEFGAALATEDEGPLL